MARPRPRCGRSHNLTTPTKVFGRLVTAPLTARRELSACESVQDRGAALVDDLRAARRRLRRKSAVCGFFTPGWNL